MAHMENIADHLEKMEGHLEGTAIALAEITDKEMDTSFSVAEATSITKSLESIAESLNALVQSKKEKQRRNGLNFSPSPKRSRYLKRSMTTTADGRKKCGKLTFSRTGKRLFIKNKHGYNSD